VREFEPIVMFSDYACPWCYLGRARLAKAIEGLDPPGQPTLIRPFPLSPDTPAEGRDLASYLRAKGLDVEAALARLAPLMQAEGLEYPSEIAGRRQWNTRRAQELALWAEEQGQPAKLEALHDRLFRAYQVENLDVHELDVLEALATEVGLDGAAGRAALERGDLAAARELSWRTATRAGITGVPTYVARGYGIVGAQPVDLLREFVLEVRAQAETETEPDLGPPQ
jgi:predicted DsbA family dithiol-disulfide isomerase